MHDNQANTYTKMLVEADRVTMHAYQEYLIKLNLYLIQSYQQPVPLEHREG